MRADDLDAIYRDTSQAIQRCHAVFSTSWAFRVYEQPEVEIAGEFIPAEWTVEIRLGRTRDAMKYIVTIPVESWELTRGTPEVWRDMVAKELDTAVQRMRKDAA